MMKINPVGGVNGIPRGNRAQATPKDNSKRPQDAVELGSSPEAARPAKQATYTAAQIAAAATGDNENVGTLMTPDARASKLAAIEKRVGEGAYNAREIIERVADRLLEEWGLETRTPQPRSG